jgi:diguanylate cyclase (GGDEF)-like protein
MSRSATRLTLTAAAIGTAITSAAAFLPFVSFAYRNASAHVALDTAEAIIALVAAYLIFGRLRERSLRRDALLVYSLIVLATTNLALSGLPGAILDRRTTAVIWASQLTRLLGGVGLLLAALSGPRTVRYSESFPIKLIAAAIGTIVGATGIVLALGSDLPLAVRTVIEPGTSATPHLEGHPLLLTGQLALVLTFAIASVRFTIEARRSNDPLLRWLGAGTALASIARVNYVLFPSIYSSFVYSGDLLRLGFYLSLLVGASAEVRQYWLRLERDKREREKLIRELETLSLVDSLTALSNRRALSTVGDQELALHGRSGRPLYGIFVDIDEMKKINDGFGHQAGDAALREVAALLRTSFRRSDLIARIGGDEFFVLTVEGDPHHAIDRLREAIARREPSDSAPYPLSLSIGVATFDPDRHASMEDLLAEADRRMYQEKRAGSDRPR